jgi:uncharacterized protein (DUF305 family)
VQPGAPGQPSTDRDARAALPPRIEHTEADVRFMQDMLHHHAQALEMSDLVADRTSNEQIRALGHRIAVSQKDEIEFIENWLRDRGEDVPPIVPTLAQGAHHHHQHGGHATHDHSDMPGMLSAEQMQELVDASGDEFDRLFLEYMIMHHDGALVMVENLFNRDGAGQETEIFGFASHVDSDQRTEILRMQRLLRDLPSPSQNE